MGISRYAGKDPEVWSELAAAPMYNFSKTAWRPNAGRHSSVIYPGPKGNWVFNAGTIWWAEA